MKKIYMPRDIVNPYEICAFTQIYHLQKHEQQYYSSKCIAYELGLKTARQCIAIKEAIKSLLGKGFLIGKEEDGLFLINNSSFDMRGRGVAFTVIYYEDIRKIIDMDYKSKLQLISYYAVLLGTRSGNSGIGQYGIRKLSNMMSVSEPTIIAYNKILEEAEILYIIHNYANDEGTNIYGHIVDKKRIYAFAKMNRPEQIIIDPNKARANWRRSVSAKYNRYIAIPEEKRQFDPDLYNDIVMYNQDMDELQEHQPGDDFSRRKKDLSVFNLTLEAE